MKTIALDKKLFKMAKTALIFVVKFAKTSNRMCRQSRQLQYVRCFEIPNRKCAEHKTTCNCPLRGHVPLLASIRMIFSHFSVAPCLMQWSSCMRNDKCPKISLNELRPLMKTRFSAMRCF